MGALVIGGILMAVYPFGPPISNPAAIPKADPFAGLWLGQALPAEKAVRTGSAIAAAGVVMQCFRCSCAIAPLSSAVSWPMRRISHILLTLEAIFLVILTVFAGVLLLGGSTVAWTSAWAGRQYSDALVWTSAFFSLVAVWWILLAYFYRGHSGARGVPVFVWAFAGLVALLALWDTASSGAPSPAVMFVPTFRSEE